MRPGLDELIEKQAASQKRTLDDVVNSEVEKKNPSSTVSQPSVAEQSTTSSTSVSEAPSIEEPTKKKGDLDADLNTKVMQIDGSKVTLQSLLDKGWTAEKISKNYNIPLVGGMEKKRETSPSLIEITKKEFATNPIFDIKNPNHEKNKEVYIDKLAQSGFDVNPLRQIAVDVTEGKKLVEENSTDAIEKALPNSSKYIVKPTVEKEYNKGRGNLLLGNNKEARKNFEKALELNKNPVSSTQTIMQGDGIKTEQKAAENPSNSLYNIGLTYLDENDHENAQNAFIQGIEKDQSNPNPKIGLANSLWETGDKKEAQRLVAQAADDYAREATALQIQADQEADAKKNQRAQDLMKMADALEAYASGDPNHELGTLGMLTPQGFVMGMAQGMIHGLGTMYKAGQDYAKGNYAKGTLEAAAGTAQTLFAAQPFVQTFNTFIAPIKDLEQKYPQNSAISALSKTVDYPFAFTTSVARDLYDYEAKEGSEEALSMELADIVIAMVGGSILHTKVNDVKSYASYVKDVAERAKNGEDVSKDLEELKNFNDAVAKINKGDIKIAAKKQGAKEVVKAIERNEPEVSEEVKKLQDELDELNKAEVNEVSAPIIEAKKLEIQDKIEKQKEKEHQQAVKDAVKKTEEQELEDKIAGLEKSIKDNEGKEEIVKVLQQELDKISPKETPMYVLGKSEAKTVELSPKISEEFAVKNSDERQEETTKENNPATANTKETTHEEKPTTKTPQTKSNKQQPSKRQDDTKDFTEGRKFAVDYVKADLIPVNPVTPKLTKAEKEAQAKKTGRILKDGTKVKSIRKAAKDISQRLDLGMKNEEKVRAIKDIKKGNYDTEAAKMLLDRLEEFHDKGAFEFIAGTGGGTHQAGHIPIADVKSHLAEVKALKEEVYKDYTEEEVAYFAEQDAAINEIIDAIEREELNDDENFNNNLNQIQNENKRTEESPTEKSTGQDVGGQKESQKGLTKEQKIEAERQSLADRIRKNKLGGAGVHIDLGITKMVYNHAVELVAIEVENGTKLGVAIAKAIKWVDSQMEGRKWNKGGFAREMNVRYEITMPNGKKAEVEVDGSKETAEMINGWYSPLEQGIIDAKTEKTTGREWKKRIAGSTEADEMKWTGVNDFLDANADKSLTKKEVQDYLRDNRIQIVEVVKGEPTEADIDALLNDEVGETMSREEAEEYLRNDEDRTKFQRYQLSGDKSGYKEVLITMPNKTPKQSIRDWYEGTMEKYRGQEGIKAPKFEDLTDREYDRVSKEWLKSQSEQKQFKSSHFDEPNILAHLRMNLRTDAEGKKTLFIEELQSDWGQTGKKEGFVEEDKDVEVASYKIDGNITYFYNKNGKQINSQDNSFLKTYKQKKQNAELSIGNKYEPIFAKAKTPTAPFVTDTNAWTKLALKTALQHAVKEGAERISWTTGEQQNERYDLGNKLDRIEYEIVSTKNKEIKSGEPIEYLYDVKSFDKNNPKTEVHRGHKYTLKQIEDTYGKDIANKISESKGYGTLTGEGLKVGGKGMIGFYGSPTKGKLGIVGQVAESMFGKGSVKETKLKTSDSEANYTWTEDTDGLQHVEYNGVEKEFKTEAEAQKYVDEIKSKQTTQHSIDITPEIKKAVESGLPLFKGLEQRKAELRASISEKLRKARGELGINKLPLDVIPDLIELAKIHIEEAAKKGVDALKEFIKDIRENYSTLLDGVEDKELEGVFDKAKEEKPPVEPPKEGGGKKKTVVGRAHEGEFTHEEVKKKFQEKGLFRDVKTVEEAIKLADELIEEHGLDEAIWQAQNGGIKESEAAVIMGRAIDKAHQAYKEATTDRDREMAAQIEADLLDELDKMNVSAGRFTGVMSKVYQMSPLGYKKYARKKLENANNSTLEKVQKQLDELKSQVEASKKEAADLMDNNIELKMKLDALQGKKATTILSPEKAQRKAELRSKVQGRFNDITTFARLLADKESMEYVGLVFEEAKGDFKQFAKEVINTLGKKLKEHIPALWKKLGGKESDIEMPSEAELKKQVRSGIEELYGDKANKKLTELAKEYFKEGEKVKGTLVDFLVEKTGLDAEAVEPYAKALEEVYDKMLNKKVENLIEQVFPAPRLIGRAKALKEHQRIVQAINLGLKTGKRRDGTPFDFEREFYSKFGLIDVNETGVNERLNEFADKIYENRNEENPLYQNMATIQLLDWIANRQLESRIKEGIIEQLYANMLYGEDTHIRNTEYNAQVVIGAMTRQILQNPKYAKTIKNAFAKSWEQGVVEMKNVIMTGMPKSGSEVKARQFGERAKDINKFLDYWTKYVNKPARLLQGFDALGNFPLRKSRVAFLLIEELKRDNPAMSTKEIAEQVNQRLYGTDTQQAKWRVDAEAQTQKYYGLTEPLFVNGERNPLYADKKYNEVYRNNKRSFFNLQDANLKDESIFKEAKDYSDTNFLMSKPKGYFGAAAEIVNSIGAAMPFGKVLTTPFVNVPFNIAANAFEYSPLGYFTTMAGKEGYGVNEKWAKKHGIEMDYSERRGKDLLYKATVGSLSMIAIKALTQLTYDDDDEGERPVLIVTADGTGNYMENKKLEKLSGSEKFEEYTIDFMGHRVSYKYSPYAALFLYSGITMDAERYGDKGNGDTPENIEKMAKAWAGFFVYMKDQSSISGIADLLNLGERSGFKKEKTKDKIYGTAEKFAAKTLRNLAVPNFIPQSYRHYKGFFDLDETSGQGFLNTLGKDIPFADQFLDKKHDHFGQAIDGKWKIPGIYNEPQNDDPLYQLARDKKYIDKLRFFTQSKIEEDNKQYPLTQQQTENIDKLRDKYAGEQIKRVYPNLKKLSNSDFADIMNSIYLGAQKRAISELKIVPNEPIRTKLDNDIYTTELDLKIMDKLYPQKEETKEEKVVLSEKEKAKDLKSLQKELDKITKKKK